MITTNPMIYAGIVAVLLGARVWQAIARRQTTRATQPCARGAERAANLEIWRFGDVEICWGLRWSLSTVFAVADAPAARPVSRYTAGHG